MSDLLIPPISPCNASAAFIKLEGEPVLDKVAETFLAIWPDFPIPSAIIFPFVCNSFSHTSLNSRPIDLARLSNPFASVLIVLLPTLRWLFSFIIFPYFRINKHKLKK